MDKKKVMMSDEELLQETEEIKEIMSKIRFVAKDNKNYVFNDNLHVSLSKILDYSRDGVLLLIEIKKEGQPITYGQILVKETPAGEEDLKKIEKIKNNQ